MKRLFNIGDNVDLVTLPNYVANRDALRVALTKMGSIPATINSVDDYDPADIAYEITLIGLDGKAPKFWALEHRLRLSIHKKQLHLEVIV